jgi:hypothetical protein
VDTAQLTAWVQDNKVAVLGVAGAGVVGLALLHRGKSGGDGPAAAAVPAELSYSAGGQVGGATGGFGSYDSTATDLYSALTPELGGISDQLQKILDGQKATPTPTPVPTPPKTTPAPAKPTNPLAALLVNPTYNGNYVRAPKNAGGGDPGIFEVQRDGSLLHLTQQQWDAAVKKNRGQVPTVQKLEKGWNGLWYTTTANLQAKNYGSPNVTRYTLDKKTGRVITAPAAK